MNVVTPPDNIQVFADGSGVAIIKSDLSTVVILTAAIKNDSPLLYTLLTNESVQKEEILKELKVQGFLNVDYSY